MRRVECASRYSIVRLASAPLLWPSIADRRLWLRILRWVRSAWISRLRPSTGRAERDIKSQLVVEDIRRKKTIVCDSLWIFLFRRSEWISEKGSENASARRRTTASGTPKTSFVVSLDAAYPLKNTWFHWFTLFNTRQATIIYVKQKSWSLLQTPKFHAKYLNKSNRRRAK